MIYQIVYILIIICLLVYCVIFALKIRRQFSVKLNKKCILFLIAHPDDESMFFGPAILSLCQDSDSKVCLLCFSTGNFYKQGEVRKKELLESCNILGISPYNVHCLDISSFPDNPQIDWDTDEVCSKITKHSSLVGADIIVTFDKGGVSNHNNHKALYQAVRKLSSQQSKQENCRYFVLETVSIWRKYLSLLDLPYTLLTGENYFISSPSDIHKARRAMAAHWSQFVWFRALYILFSRYMIMNTFQELKPRSFLVQSS